MRLSVLLLACWFAGCAPTDEVIPAGPVVWFDQDGTFCPGAEPPGFGRSGETEWDLDTLARSDARFRLTAFVGEASTSRPVRSGGNPRYVQEQTQYGREVPYGYRLEPLGNASAPDAEDLTVSSMLDRLECTHVVGGAAQATTWRIGLPFGIWRERSYRYRPRRQLETRPMAHQSRSSAMPLSKSDTFDHQVFCMRGYDLAERSLYRHTVVVRVESDGRPPVTLAHTAQRLADPITCSPPDPADIW